MMAQAKDRPRRMTGYLRVSAVGRRDVLSESYQTERVQREKIERWAQGAGVEIVAWQLDRDVSGDKPFAERAGGRRIMEAIEAGQTEGVVVSTLDRYARGTVASALLAIYDLHEQGGKVHALDMPELDPTDETSEFTWTLMLGLARMERRRVTRRWIETKTDAIGRGLPSSPWVPLGYRRAGTGRADADKRLVPDEQTAPIVRRAFELAGGEGLHAAAAYLAAERPGGHWSIGNVRRLLANRKYRGEVWHGDLRNTAAHPALVSEGEWLLAQHEPGESHAPAGDYPLSGLPSCATCGGPLVGSHQGAGRKVYKCSRGVKRAGSKQCQRPASIGAVRLEAYLRGLASAALKDTAVAGEVGDVPAREQALAATQAERDAWIAGASIAAMGAEAYNAEAERQRMRVEGAQAAYADELVRSRPRKVVPAASVLTMPAADFGALAQDVFASVTVAPGRLPAEPRDDADAEAFERYGAVLAERLRERVTVELRRAEQLAA